jgi:hypothetical protein
MLSSLLLFFARFFDDGEYFLCCKCRSRKDNFERAVEHESNGNSSAAYECYQKAVDISPTIARELIQVERNLFLSELVWLM